jgi:hypothetical protein
VRGFAVCLVAGGSGRDSCKKAREKRISHERSIVLTPAGSHKSGLNANSTITGNLSDSPTLLDQGVGEEGFCSLTIEG